MGQRNGFFNIAELIVCCTIIIVVATFIFMYANPSEINKRSRDAIRLADLSNLQQRINLILLERGNEDPFLLCFNLPPPCGESSFPKNTTTTNITGRGWVKINFDKNPLLPIDPINNQFFNYQYLGKGRFFKLTTILESDRYKDLMQQDGGPDPLKYEIGNNLKLTP